ncbi:MAG: CAP domain-containing protein [Bryobacterales bacterium]|nr:CAP domain-containing protein [Bryobacterales bacterium]
MRLPILILAALPILGAPPELSPTESAVVRLLNEARTAPARFAQLHIAPHARESREAAECLREMSLMAPLPALTVATPLVQAARDHAEASSAAGITGHQGADGSNLDQRISRYADWVGSISENLYYGRDNAEEIVVQLLIDRGVAGRGHRRNILNAKMAAAGVAVRRHPRYGSICVMDFASLLRPLQQRRAR